MITCDVDSNHYPIIYSQFIDSASEGAGRLRHGHGAAAAGFATLSNIKCVQQVGKCTRKWLQGRQEEAVDTWRHGDLGAGQAMHMEIGSQGRPGAAHTKASFSPFASLQSDPHSSCFVTAVIDG